MHNEAMTYLIPPMLEDASALLGDFVTLYRERDILQMQIISLERRANRTRGETEMTEAVLHAKVAGARQELSQTQLEKDQMERQWNEACNQLEEVQAKLRTAQSQLAKTAGDPTYSQPMVGKLETELVVVLRQLEATLKSPVPAPPGSETVCLKAFVVSISQMTLGTTPP